MLTAGAMARRGRAHPRPVTGRAVSAARRGLYGALMLPETIPSPAVELVPAGPPNPALIHVASLSPGTRPSSINSLRIIAGIVAPGAAWDVFPWWQLRAEHIGAIRAELAGRYAPATANKMLVTLRSVMRAGWRLGLIDGEALGRLLDVKRVPGERPPAGRDISPAEITAILATCDGSPVGIRDRAILLVLRHGLRRGELAALDLADFDPGSGDLTVIRGKGNKTRVIPLHDEAAVAVKNWIDIRGDWTGPMWTAIGPHVKTRYGRRLSFAVIYKMVRSRARRAGLDQPPTLHDWRRTMAGDLLDAGIDLPTIAAIMGHSGINLIARYDRRPAEARRLAVGRLYMPGDRPRTAK